jgi:hypothetical protein
MNFLKNYVMVLAKEQEAKKVSIPKLKAKKSGGTGGLQILGDPTAYKIAQKLYFDLVGQQSMAMFPQFLSELDGLLLKHKKSMPKDTEDDDEDEEDEEESVDLTEEEIKL